MSRDKSRRPHAAARKIEKGLTPAMRAAFAANKSGDRTVAAATLRGLEQRGLIRRGAKGRWHWTAFARMVRNGSKFPVPETHPVTDRVGGVGGDADT
jgi:hypothetical protein